MLWRYAADTLRSQNLGLNLTAKRHVDVQFFNIQITQKNIT